MPRRTRRRQTSSSSDLPFRSPQSRNINTPPSGADSRTGSRRIIRVVRRNGRYVVDERSPRSSDQCVSESILTPGSVSSDHAVNDNRNRASPTPLVPRRRVRIIFRHASSGRIPDSSASDSSSRLEAQEAIASTGMVESSLPRSMVVGEATCAGDARQLSRSDELQDNSCPPQREGRTRPSDDEWPSSSNKRSKNDHADPVSDAAIQPSEQSNEQLQGSQRDRTGRSMDEVPFDQLERLYSWVYDDQAPMPPRYQRQPLHLLGSRPHPRSISDDEASLSSPDLLDAVLSVYARHLNTGRDNHSPLDSESDCPPPARRGHEESDDESDWGQDEGYGSDLSDSDQDISDPVAAEFGQSEDEDFDEDCEPYPGWLAEQYHLDSPSRLQTVQRTDKDMSSGNDGDVSSSSDDDSVGSGPCPCECCAWRADGGVSNSSDDDDWPSENPRETEAAAEFDRRIDYLGYARY